MPKPMVMVINLAGRTDRKRWVELTLQPSVKHHDFQFIKAVDKSSLVTDATCNGRDLHLHKDANPKFTIDGTCDGVPDSQQMGAFAERAPCTSNVYNIIGLGPTLDSSKQKLDKTDTSDFQSDSDCCGDTHVDVTLECEPSPQRNTENDRTNKSNSILNAAQTPLSEPVSPSCCAKTRFRPFSEWKLDSDGLRDVQRRWNHLCADPVHADEIAKFYGRKITWGEFCCTLSHYKAWQTALRSRAPYAIVLEVHA